MKKSLSYSFALVLAFVTSIPQVSLAQLELTAANSIIPLLDQQVTAMTYPAISIGDLDPIAAARGENQTWDISGATFGSPSAFVSEYRVPPLSDLPGWSVWSLAPEPPNYAIVAFDVIDEEQFPDTVQLAFMHYLDDSQLLNWGFSGMADATDDGVLDTVLVGNDPPEVEFMFPTRFGDEWTSEWEQVFLVVGGPSFRAGDASRSKKVVGSGTLITPMGSAEVLQIEEEFTITAFGMTLVSEKAVQFLGPFQEVAGKTTLANHSLRLILDDQGSVVSGEYSVIEVEGGGDPTAAESSDEVPSGFEIQANYPNPFNPSTTLQYTVPASGRLAVTVHDIMGREVDRIVDEIVSAGEHSVTWEAGNLPSGLYMVRLAMDGEVRVRSVVLQK